MPIRRYNRYWRSSGDVAIKHVARAAWWHLQGHERRRRFNGICGVVTAGAPRRFDRLLS